MRLKNAQTTRSKRGVFAVISGSSSVHINMPLFSWSQRNTYTPAVHNTSAENSCLVQQYSILVKQFRMRIQKAALMSKDVQKNIARRLVAELKQRSVLLYILGTRRHAFSHKTQTLTAVGTCRKHAVPQLKARIVRRASGTMFEWSLLRTEPAALIRVKICCSNG